MFRYVADEFNKLFNSSTSNKSQQQQQQPRNPSVNATDINNNRIGSLSDTSRSKKKNLQERPVNVSSFLNDNTGSFIDEFNWFQVNKHSNNQDLR